MTTGVPSFRQKMLWSGTLSFSGPGAGFSMVRRSFQDAAYDLARQVRPNLTRCGLAGVSGDTGSAATGSASASSVPLSRRALLRALESVSGAGTKTSFFAGVPAASGVSGVSGVSGTSATSVDLRFLDF
eukprot:CAMPEP_0194281854 /NCGR_PEP_ID=MMETSP0169-20130528/21733_1 /TAXON_ID=218684 /ORGANISM="Corethron pennatum, Strain L29A3" /LENGTH=128 /DNA_ID=CAMNT_0039027025 /DNA_START=55 /DNA_END=438 /DNA_ORIENTATION=+